LPTSEVLGRRSFWAKTSQLVMAGLVPAISLRHVPDVRQFYVYILASRPGGAIYVGVTNDLVRRVYEHRKIVRTVSSTKSYISFKGRFWKIPQAFRGERLAIRPRTPDGRYAVCFGAYEIATIDLTNPESVSDVSEHVSAMSPD
jgi:hypothetical protein